MFELVFNHADRFIENVRFVDFVDLFLVSAFLYFFINWLRQSASKRIMVTIVLFLSLYVFSRLFELYLTEMLIRAIMIIVLLASVIVFQSDIRRMVDIVGMWDFFRKNKIRKTSSRTVDLLTEAVSKLAEKKTGALIAIKGREPWDRPIHGGIPLEGYISQPLLYSIFSTSSPGHDGAILLEDDRILKFGCHLTLSTNLKELENVGTRHAAALGLSEQCDALVIVVSEERGTISIAQDGKLQIIQSTSILKERLEKYWEKHYSVESEPIISAWKKTSFKTAIASFFITMLFWFVFAYQSDVVYRSYRIPIEWRNLQSNLEIVETEPQEARITLTGSEQAFRNFNPSALAISLDLERLKKGQNRFLVAEDNLSLPNDLKLYSVEPQVVKIKAEKMHTIKVPIKVQTVGSLSRRLRLEYLSTDPQTIVLRVPEDNSGRPDVVLTEPVNLNGIKSTTVIKSRLLPPSNSKLQQLQSPEVEVKIAIKK